MNKLLLCFAMMLACLTASSQKVYFVYLQSEQEQPFFVKMDEKIYSSSASGYLILSRLKDSTYNFAIGFPHNKWPEQRFVLNVKGKDQGYLLKNFGDKGWGLFNLQTLAVQMPMAANVGSAMQTEKAAESPFMDLLAKAADDSTLKNKPVFAKLEEKKAEQTREIIQPAVVREEQKEQVAQKPAEKKEEPKPANTEEARNNAISDQQSATADKPADREDEGKTVAKAEPKPELNTETKQVEAEKKPDTREEAKDQSNKEKKEPVNVTKEEKPAEDPANKPSKITKRAETTTDEGVSVIFTEERQDGARDTIAILIPDQKKTVAQPNMQSSPQEKKFLDISTEKEVTPAKDTVAMAARVENKPTMDIVKPFKGNICKEVAADADFLKLRKNMAGETDDDDMVDEARKYFKSKCFTTVQLRNLSTLFLDDLGKYKFFDMAYIFVSDIENFPSLQSELKNEYYINRFKAMLK